MAFLRNKRKLAAVSRETPENTKTQSRNTLHPEMAQEYLSQVSEKIEGEALKNFQKNAAGRSHAFWVPCINFMDLLCNYYDQSTFPYFVPLLGV